MSQRQLKKVCNILIRDASSAEPFRGFHDDLHIAGWLCYLTNIHSQYVVKESSSKFTSRKLNDMSQDRHPKLWYPARFTHGGIQGPSKPHAYRRHCVIILNNPLKNKHLLADVCSQGIRYIKARNYWFVADVVH